LRGRKPLARFIRHETGLSRLRAHRHVALDRRLEQRAQSFPALVPIHRKDRELDRLGHRAIRSVRRVEANSTGNRMTLPPRDISSKRIELSEQRTNRGHDIRWDSSTQA
jgi:hypothetical protein